MSYSRIRFILIFSFLSLGLLLHLKTGIRGASYLYAAAAVLVLTHLLFGTVWEAFSLLKRGYPEKAERTLALVRFPNLLIRRNRAYYFFTKGMIHLQRKELDQAVPLLLEANRLGLSRRVDRALLQLNLAHIYYVEKDFDQARHYLDEAKSQQADDLLIRDNLAKLERALGR